MTVMTLLGPWPKWSMLPQMGAIVKKQWTNCRRCGHGLVSLTDPQRTQRDQAH